MTPDDILEIGCCVGILHRILACAMCTDYVAETLGERTEGLAMWQPLYLNMMVYKSKEKKKK
jgi:hypothetical protein